MIHSFSTQKVAKIKKTHHEISGWMYKNWVSIRLLLLSLRRSSCYSGRVLRLWLEVHSNGLLRLRLLGLANLLRLHLARGVPRCT